MKPLNLDNKPCSPISSNCVIWQGPDIPCIKLCSGDTVSDVVFKLATELCAVLDTLNITNYDLSCFNLTACGPNDFQALIQFLIDRICALQSEVTTIGDPATSPVNTTKTTTAETLVTVAPCFVVGNVTVMTVSEYAQAIGETVCSLATQITAILNSINSLDIRVTALEAAPAPTFTIPSIIVDCSLSPAVLSGNSYQIDVVLDALINDDTRGYCSLIAATDEPAAIIQAVQSQCIADSDLTLTSGIPFIAAYAGSWVDNGNLYTAANAINNLWLVVCDIYNYLQEGITVTVLPTSTLNVSFNQLTSNEFTLSAAIKDSGWIDLEGFDYYAGGIPKPQIRRIGNEIHFRGDIYVPLDNPSSPGTVVPLTSLTYYGINETTSYNSINGCTPFTGIGGVTISIPDNAILFNNATSVIPTGILGALTNLDGYSFINSEIIYRPINLNGTYGSVLTGIIRVRLTNDGILELYTLESSEKSDIRIAAAGSSHLRLITSNVQRTYNVPNNSGATATIQNAPSAATYSPDLDAFALTWPFDCNAAKADQIGGFSFKIDGLKAYIPVCSLDTAYTGYVCP
jgi:hypothetical protein